MPPDNIEMPFLLRIDILFSVAHRVSNGHGIYNSIFGNGRGSATLSWSILFASYLQSHEPRLCHRLEAKYLFSCGVAFISVARLVINEHGVENSIFVNGRGSAALSLIILL